MADYGNMDPAFKQECLDRWRMARKWLRHNTKSERRRMLDALEQKHGTHYTDKMRQELIRQWQARQAE